VVNVGGGVVHVSRRGGLSDRFTWETVAPGGGVEADEVGGRPGLTNRDVGIAHLEGGTALRAAGEDLQAERHAVAPRPTSICTWPMSDLVSLGRQDQRVGPPARATVTLLSTLTVGGSARPAAQHLLGRLLRPSSGCCGTASWRGEFAGRVNFGDLVQRASATARRCGPSLITSLSAQRTAARPAGSAPGLAYHTRIVCDPVSSEDSDVGFPGGGQAAGRPNEAVSTNGPGQRRAGVESANLGEQLGRGARGAGPGAAAWARRDQGPGQGPRRVTTQRAGPGSPTGARREQLRYLSHVSHSAVPSLCGAP